MDDGPTPPTPVSNRALTVLAGIIATILLGWVLIAGAKVLQPLVIAILLANVLQPVVRLMRRVFIPSFVTVILLLALLVWALIRGGTLLYTEARSFIDDSGGYNEVVNTLIRGVPDWVPQPLIDWIRSVDPQTPIVNLIGTVNSFLGGAFLVVLYMLFIFAEQQVFRRKILAVARARSEHASQVLDTISTGIQRYLFVKTITSLATGLVIYTVLKSLAIPYAELFAFLTYLLNYIPTFGSFAAAVLPVATALAKGGGVDGEWQFTTTLVVAGAYLVTNVLLGSLLEPRLLGRELNLSPLVILVSVVVWAVLWGVPGTFLAVPLTASLQIVLANFETTRPIAVMLSNGPPRDRGWSAGVKKRKKRHVRPA